MATPVAESGQDALQEDLSPTAQENLEFLLQDVRSGKVELQRNSDGKVRIVYKDEKIIPLSHVDKSKAHTVQMGKDKEDMKVRMNVCLEMINAIKENRAPLGVTLDPSKAKPSAVGKYVEGEQFERLADVLGKGNCAGDIVVVKDNKTDAEHAMKTVMISEFSEHEVRAWVDLDESGSCPSLYTFYLDGNKVKFHMEVVNGETWDTIINERMSQLWAGSPGLVRPFSLCMFHGLLNLVQEMHDKNWGHRDLHGGNVMLTKEEMTLKVLDFGMARPLRDKFSFNHRAMKDDILNAVRLFCGLYVGDDFTNNYVLEEVLKSGNLEKVLAQTAGLKEEEKMELLQLISLTYEVLKDPNQVGYGDTSGVRERIEGSLFPKNKEDIMRQAAALLFPEYYYRDQALHSTMGRETVDGAGGDNQPASRSIVSPAAMRMERSRPMVVEKRIQFDMEAAARAIPDELLSRLNIFL